MSLILHSRMAWEFKNIKSEIIQFDLRIKIFKKNEVKEWNKTVIYK